MSALEITFFVVACAFGIIGFITSVFMYSRLRAIRRAYGGQMKSTAIEFSRLPTAEDELDFDDD